ncbi:MAG: hypothetical protein F7B59_03350 [Desulfurococcales archaeon]|nr:hypothetical protein [Desulfurococcales archaeon]
MSSLGEVCHLIRVLDKIAEPRRNIYPGFNKAHVFLAIKWISQSPRSRFFLEKNLEIGEASVKTLIRRLKEEGLVETSKYSGSTATEKGSYIARELDSHIRIYKAVCNPTSNHDLLSIMPNVPPPKEMIEVYALRDYLVRSGCDVSLIGGYHSNELHAPGIDSNYIEDLRKCIDASVDYDFKAVAKAVASQGIFVFFPRNKLSRCLDGILSFLLSKC